MVSKNVLLSKYAVITWCWHDRVFIETEDAGNYIWSDPRLGGNNLMQSFRGSRKDYLRGLKTPHGREKGLMKVSEYCGNSFELRA